MVFWCTDDEYKAISLRKGRNQLGSWARSILLKEKVPHQVPKSDPELLRHLSLIGNNINQIARRVNNYNDRITATEIIMLLKNIKDEINNYDT
jgi:hypothetical protein